LGGKGVFFAFQIHHWFEEAAKVTAFVSKDDLNLPSQIFISICSTKMNNTDLRSGVFALQV